MFFFDIITCLRDRHLHHWNHKISMANTVVRMLSDRSSYILGHSIMIFGGQPICPAWFSLEISLVSILQDGVILKPYVDRTLLLNWGLTPDHHAGESSYHPLSYHGCVFYCLNDGQALVTRNLLVPFQPDDIIWEMCFCWLFIVLDFWMERR